MREDIIFNMNYIDYMNNRKEIWEQLWYETKWDWIMERLINWEDTWRKEFQIGKN